MKEETYLDDWHCELSKILDKYCQEPTTMRDDPHLELSGGAFVDAGHLEQNFTFDYICTCEE